MRDSHVFRQLSTWWRGSNHTTARRRPRLSAFHSTLRAEPLEDRRLLAVLTIAQENALPGTSPDVWDVGFGSANIEGFAAQMSVNHGQTIQFKVSTDADAYRLDIYRMGYYGGLGARYITTINPNASLAQNQPAAVENQSTGLVDAGNWNVSAQWAVPADATSGVYVADLIREDGTDGASQIIFVVRNDEGHSDIVYKTADATWQAYNDWGGNSLYTGDGTTKSTDGRAYGVSYNRPFDYNLRSYNPDSFFFAAETSMVRFLEKNGFDVSYVATQDLDQRGALLLNHKILMTAGHDEYWSPAERSAVETARDAGVSLGFFGGNDMFWKTYWTSSSFDSTTPDRTLVCYKETHANAIIDPVNPNVWTGTWRDPRFSPPADGGRPENAVMGTMFTVNSDGTSHPITVPGTDANLRIWRNTSIANLSASQSAALSDFVLGEESDEDVDNGFRPAGLIDLSSTIFNTTSLLQDYGSNYAAGTSTHSLTMYRAASGALVFSAGTLQWSWGLDSTHDGQATTVDSRMQQAMINLLADMGAQPATLQSGLVAATESTDKTAPTSTITSPLQGAILQAGVPITIQGTAQDGGGGVVAGVEVSVDGGLTWHPATGRSNWTYAWTPRTSGTMTIKSRAVDDSGNIEPPPAGITVNPPAVGTTTFSLWNNATTPTIVDSGEAQAVEVGMKIRSDSDAFISGLKFYKSTANTGTHTASLWTTSGQLLATATFANETASGWQQVNFATPVAITAGTTYVASYHTTTGHYSSTQNYFTTLGVDSGLLHALANGVSGGNGVYLYGAGGFPTQSFQSSNYWVDVVLNTTPVADTTAPTVTSFAPAGGATNVSINAAATITFSEALNASTVTSSTVFLRDSSNVVLPTSVAYNSTTHAVMLTPTSPLANSATYTIVVKGGSAGVKDVAGNALAVDVTSSFTTIAPSGSPAPLPSPSLFSLWTNSTTPAIVDSGDTQAVELGTKFTSATNGTITSLRFYKSAANTGTHTASLWTASGQLLATATFANETASGWQQVNFATPVAITAGTTYVVSYHTTSGHYSVSRSYFTSQFTSGSLHVPANGGVYLYGAGGFPTLTFQGSNYWVDVVLNTTPVADTTAPTVTSFAPAGSLTNVAINAVATITFSEALNASTVTSSTVFLRDASNVVLPTTVAYNSTTHAVTLTPTSPLTNSATYTIVVKGGSAGVKDVAGNALAVDVTSSFTTIAPSGSPAPLPSPSLLSLWTNSTTPAIVDSGDTQAVELGTKFTSDTNGSITGLKFYKSAANTGTHTASLWTASGQLLATATFSNETASGWQQVNFATPVAITAGTTYVVSYHTTSGHYSVSRSYFTSPFTSGSLHAPANGGVYLYGAGGFPTLTFQGSNYWVDVVLNTTPVADTTAPTVTSFAPAGGATNVSINAAATITFSEALNASTVTSSTVFLRDSSNVVLPTTVAYNTTTHAVTLTPASPLANSATYTIVVKGGSAGVKDVAGNALAVDALSSFTTIATISTPVSLWSAATTPAIVDSGDTQAVELGTKFTSDSNGFITGLKFYKSAANTGTHTASLWTASGQLLATGTFTNETASGWQQVNFAMPVAITAGTTYVASYHTTAGHYSVNRSYFTSQFTSGRLHVPTNGGVYLYGAGGFPTQTYQSSNYWVDVLFSAN
jgi:hypothetical protein